MAQEYYVDNLTSRFIKCLLWDTYIPTVDIWKPGKNIIKDFTYITQDKYIVKAKYDYPNKNINHAPKGALDSDYFEIVDNFIEGKFYRGITSNFQSNSALYDSDTHYMLGQYLRYLRDMYDLDLMAYYNCYSGESSDKIRINSDSTINKNNNIDDGKITYIVPIKFNQSYSIYYQSNVPFNILPVYYNGVDVFNVKDSNGDIIESTRVNNCSIKNPYIFKSVKVNADSLYYETATARLLEDYLALIIEVPKTNYSNILVLEGNYSDIKINLSTSENGVLNNILPKILLGNLDINLVTKTDLNNIFKSYPSLTQNIGNINYAFSDRLIEYLLDSPIVDKDKIRYNIKRVQDRVSSENFSDTFGKNNSIGRYEASYIPDIWDANLRYYIYDLVTQNDKKKLYKDINGYVDKDTESILDKIKVEEGDWNV